MSGTVSSAFRNVGHSVTSCDLLPSLVPGNHYQGDVRDILYNGFDMLIAFPPCTYLSYAGMKYWNLPGRYHSRLEALMFFDILYSAPIKKICIENPLGLASLVFRQPDQIIHPYYFGDPYMKRTCLWLKNLPKLYFNICDDLFFQSTASKNPKPIHITSDGNHLNWIDYHTPGKQRSINKSKFFQSVAIAMAHQWS